MTTVRPIRAPKETIDRTVDFATQNGFRMIWIDQVIHRSDMSFVTSQVLTQRKGMYRARQ